MFDERISSLAFIGDGVELGERVTIGPGAVLLGPLTVADDVFIGSGSHIGAPPEMTDQRQNPAWAGDLNHAGVDIGEAAVIREGVVIHQGSYRATTVGPGSWVLNRAYLAHDVVLDERVTVSAGVSIGGHCEIGASVNLGMNAAVHQRTFIGAGCMVGMNTPVSRDLPPFVKAYGSPMRMHNLNFVGLQRLGVPEEQIEQLRTAYAAGDYLLEHAPARWNAALQSAITTWVSRLDRSVATPAAAGFAPRL